MKNSSSPIRRLFAFATVPALAITGLTATLVVAPLASSPAHAAIGECPDGTVPVVTPGEPLYTDNNVAVYAAGNFVADEAAAEMEGLVVVEGNATFDKKNGGTFNVGTVGVGSGIVPSPGSTMLAVGGNVVVGPATRLDIGANATNTDGTLLGGNLDVGGTVTPTPPTTQIELNHGAISDGMGKEATAPYGEDGGLFLKKVQTASADLSALPATGKTTVSGQSVLFDGTGITDNPIVFTLTAAQLSTITEVNFKGIPETTEDGKVYPVVINVTGAGPVTFSPNYFSDDGERADVFSSAKFGLLSMRTMWNFTDATAVTLGGTNQFLGSTMVPTSGASLTVSASTNGRVYSGGDLHMNGTGNEMHNFPWAGPGGFECVPIPTETGSISLEKLLADGTAAYLPVDDQGRLPKFSGEITCGLEEGTYREPWTLRPGEGAITIDGLPIGRTCTLTEDLSTTGVTQSTKPLVGLAFKDPVWTINGKTVAAPLTFVVPAPDAATQIAVTVTNALQMGSFTVKKDFDPSTSGFTGGFSVAYSCAANGPKGTLSLKAGETSPKIEAPVGSTCSVTEPTLPTPPAGWSWGTPTISPTSFTIDKDGQAVAVTVTNTISQDDVATGGFSLTKVVNNPADLSYTNSFTGTWSCVLGDTTRTGTWRTSAGGEPVVVRDVALGSSCAVTENTPKDPEAGSWAAPKISPASFTVTKKDQLVDVVVTNTISQHDVASGGFSITKVVKNPTDVSYTNSFTGTWSCTIGDTTRTGTWETAAGGEPVFVHDLPLGSACTVTENTPKAPEKGSWAAPKISPASFTVTTKDQLVDVVVTNTLDDDTAGSFTITKTVTNDSNLDVPDTYHGATTCIVDGKSVTYPWALAAGATAPLQSVPVGTTCTVSEVLPAAPVGGAWSTPKISPATFTVTGDGTVVAVTVANTVTPSLPNTGGTIAWWAVGVGAGLLILGGGTFWGASRRRRTS